MSHSVAQLEVFPTDLQMRRIDPACNMRRFYRMSIQPDLFGAPAWCANGAALEFPDTVRNPTDFVIPDTPGGFRLVIACAVAAFCRS